MKIGITCYPTYGGSGVVATELGIELAARGHAIHFRCHAPGVEELRVDLMSKLRLLGGFAGSRRPAKPSFCPKSA